MPLSAYRILQLGTGVALDFCGKLFADFGADVIKLEPAGGDPLRQMPPILANGESGLFAWLNTNKRSVTQSPETLATLLQGADVLLDATANNDFRHPGLAVTAISWFGDHGPYAEFAATEATIRALGGLVALTGRAEGPPTIALTANPGSSLAWPRSSQPLPDCTTGNPAAAAFPSARMKPPSISRNTRPPSPGMPASPATASGSIVSAVTTQSAYIGRNAA